MNMVREPPRRGDPDEDTLTYSARGPSRWRVTKGVSLEGLLGITLALIGGIYAFAFLTARVEQAERKQQEFNEWTVRHETADRENGARLDQRLQGIEQRLDILIGRIDSPKAK